MLHDYADLTAASDGELAVVQTFLPPRRVVGNELCRITRIKFNLTLCYSKKLAKNCRFE